MTTEKTILEEVDYPSEILDFIALNDDVKITDEMEKKIKQTANSSLLKVTKSIGSAPIEILKVEDYNEDFLKQNF